MSQTVALCALIKTMLLLAEKFVLVRLGQWMNSDFATTWRNMQTPLHSVVHSIAATALYPTLLSATVAWRPALILEMKSVSAHFQKNTASVSEGKANTRIK